MLQLESTAGWKLKEHLLSFESDMKTCADSQPRFLGVTDVTFRALHDETAGAALTNQAADAFS